MATLDVKPTRIELIKITKRINLAKRGLELLKMKRSSLVREFFAIARTVRGMRENLRAEVAMAMNTLKMAELLTGTMEIERIAYMSSDSTIALESKNVMGVKVPELDINYSQTVLTQTYRAVSVPTAINDAIKKYEKLFYDIIEVAQKENTMRKLLHEIDKTKRRSNAIENMLIPRLSSTKKYIRLRLDEIERETFTTLKTIKRKLLEQKEKQANS